MRVVVSGGTGFIGRALVHALMARGDDVVVLTRGQPRSFSHACGECGRGAKAELVAWTPQEAGPWQRVVDGADAVVNLVGRKIAGRWTRSAKEEIRTSRIEPTSLLARAIADAKSRPRVFVSISAAGYYGTKTGDRILTEDDPPGDDFLASICRAWEEATAPARDAGVRVVVPRMGLVLGRRGGLLAELVPMFRGFVGGPIGDGRQYVPWVHIRDAVRAIEAMMLRDDMQGAYNTTAPEPVTMNDFARALGAALGRPAAFRVPAFAVRAAFGEASEAMLTGQRLVPKRLVDASFAFVFPDLGSALADLV